MLSKESLKPIIWTFTIASYLGRVPVRWDTSVGRLRPYSANGKDRINHIISNIFMRIFILGHIGMIVYVCGLLWLSKNVQPEEIICGILCICLFVMSLLTHLANLFHMDPFVLYVNSLLDFNDEYGQKRTLLFDLVVKISYLYRYLPFNSQLNFTKKPELRETD